MVVGDGGGEALKQVDERDDFVALQLQTRQALPPELGGLGAVGELAVAIGGGEEDLEGSGDPW